MAAVASGALAFAPATDAKAITSQERAELTYSEVKGSGLAAQCPVVRDEYAEGPEALKPGKYKLDMCAEPMDFNVKSKSQDEYEGTKLLTRNSYTLEGMPVDLEVRVGGEGKVQKEEGGMDFNPVGTHLFFPYEHFVDGKFKALLAFRLLCKNLAASVFR